MSWEKDGIAVEPRRNHRRRRLAKWSRAAIVQELRRLHRAGKDIWSRALRESRQSLHSAAIHWFGSYRKAIEAAGINYQKVSRGPRRFWTRDSIARELKRLHRAGAPIWYAAMEREMPQLAIAAYRHFGCYRKAVEAAGIDYASVRIRPMPSWNGKRVLSEMRRMRRDGDGLWGRAVRRVRPYLISAATKHFGSYRAAAKAAAIDLESLKPPTFRFWSPRKIVDDLRQLNQGGALRPSRLSRSRPRLLSACRRQFGTYRKALESAGIEYASVARVIGRPLSKAQVTSWIQRLYDRGEDLRMSHLLKSAPRLMNGARRRFGSYRAAVLASGLEYPPPPPLRHWTAKLVLKTLRELNAKNVDLRFAPMKRKFMPLFEAAKYYFGTYVKAVEAANINYDDVVRRNLRRHPAVSQPPAARKRAKASAIPSDSAVRRKRNKDRTSTRTRR